MKIITYPIIKLLTLKVDVCLATTYASVFLVSDIFEKSMCGCRRTLGHFIWFVRLLMNFREVFGFIYYVVLFWYKCFYSRYLLLVVDLSIHRSIGQSNHLSRRFGLPIIGWCKCVEPADSWQIAAMESASFLWCDH